MNITSKAFNELLPLINKQLYISLADMKGPYNKTLSEISATFTKAGQPSSSNYLNAIAEERCNQLKRIGTVVINSVFSTMEADQQIVSDENYHDIRNFVFQILQHELNQLLKAVGQTLTSINNVPNGQGADLWNKRLYTAFDQEKARVDLQLDKALLANKARAVHSQNRKQIVNPSIGFKDLLHENVIKNSLHHYESGHYRDAVLNAIVGVFDFLRAKTGCRVDGDKLATAVFAPARPLLVVGDLDTESGQSEQKGFMAMLQGAFQAIRNPKAHTLESDLTHVTAAQYLVFISMLARRIEQAKAYEPKGN